MQTAPPVAAPAAWPAPARNRPPALTDNAAATRRRILSRAIRSLLSNRRLLKRRQLGQENPSQTRRYRARRGARRPLSRLISRQRAERGAEGAGHVGHRQGLSVAYGGAAAHHHVAHVG